MKDKLGLVVVEDKNGVAIQVFTDPDMARSWFRELSGKMTDEPWRATFVDLRFDPEFKVSGEVKELPEKSQQPVFGWRLGSGPIPEPVKKEESDVDGKQDGEGKNRGNGV